jgi:hypothetical protein
VCALEKAHHKLISLEKTFYSKQVLAQEPAGMQVTIQQAHINIKLATILSLTVQL